MTSELERVRAIALALPEVSERFSHGAPCFYVGDKRPLCYFHGAEFGGDDRISLWVKSTGEAQDDAVASDPDLFFRPTPSSSGVFADWLGVYLDAPHVDWAEVAAVITDGFRLVATKKLVRQLDDAAG